MISLNINIIIIIAATALIFLVGYVLYAIIMPKSAVNKSDKDFQLTTEKILENVKLLFEQGEYALAQLLAIKYLERRPDNKEVRRYLAKAYFKDSKYNNAIKQCITILKKEPNDIETRKTLGDCYIQKGFLNKAVKEYESIFDYRSNDKEVVRTLAELYRDTEQLYSAVTVYNILAGLLTQSDEIAEVHSILADLNEAVHDYPAAFESYKTRLDIYPTDVETNQKLVTLYMKLNNHPKAIETLLYMLSFVSKPKDLLWVYENLVQLYVVTEDYEKAIEYSNKMLDVQGSDKFKIQDNIAQYNLKLKNFDVGIGILEELVMMSQSAYDVTVELSKAYIEQGNFEKALEKYTTLLDKATQKEAKNVRMLICELYIQWASTEIEKNDFTQAKMLLDKAIEYNVLNPEIYYQKAINSTKQRDYSAAVDYLHTALEYDKFNDYHEKYLIALAEAHNNLGNFFEEKKALVDLLKINPKHPMALYHSGLMCVSQHDTKNAEEYFLKALEYDPNLLKAKYNLALLYESSDKNKAKELYTEILSEDPSFSEARQALADMSTSSDFY